MRGGLTDYVGAGARLTPERGLALDPRRWGWQPKVDGCYARVSLDRRGCVSNVLSRAGAPIAAAAELLGIVAGPPDSVLHGELEAHTEAGARAAAGRGWRLLHLFDCTRCAGADVARAPYTERYGMLHRMQAELELGGRANPWVRDDQGDHHDVRTGRYCRTIPRDVRRFPVVTLARGAGAGERLWREHVDLGGGEGAVAVRLDAPAGARSGKRKIKSADTIDAVVIAGDTRAVVLAYGGHRFAVSAGGRVYTAGELVEVAHDGWYESAVMPRFARILRARRDLS